jgi:hypothetical protein
MGQERGTLSNCTVEIHVFFNEGEGTATWLFTDLIDAIRNYGREDMRGNRHLNLVLDNGATVWMVTNRDRTTTTVSHEKGYLNVSQDGLIMMNEELRESIYWSKFVSPSSVRQTVERLDAEMAQVGRFDADTKKRLYVPAEESVALEKASVDSIFRPPWRQVHLPVTSDTPDERVLACFDRPEELTIIGRKKELALITTKRGLARRLEVTDQVLAERGVGPDDFDKMKREDQLAVIREVDRRLNAVVES